MESSYTKAKSADDRLLALACTFCALEELITLQTSDGIELTDTGRDGLANLFGMFHDEIIKIMEMLPSNIIEGCNG